MLKVALSHDIDRTKKTYQYLTKPLRALMKLNFKALKNQLNSFGNNKNYWTFEEIIKIEEENNVKSTYFFLNETIKVNFLKLGTYKLALGRYKISDPKIMELIKRLDKGGWEIGVHGSYNSFRDKELLNREKLTLEKIVGHEVIGTRQHYLNLNDNTWKIQKDIGFKYDSSLGYNGSKTKIGFIDEHLKPFFPFKDEFLVIPLVLMDANFMGIQDRWHELEKLIDLCIQNDAYLVVNFHNHVYNEKEFPGYKTAYKKIIEMCKAKNATFYTMKEIYETELQKSKLPVQP